METSVVDGTLRSQSPKGYFEKKGVALLAVRYWGRSKRERETDR